MWSRLAIFAIPALVACLPAKSDDDDDDDDGGSAADSGWDGDFDGGAGDGGGGDGGGGDGGGGDGGGGDGGGGDGGGDGGADGVEWPEGDATGCDLTGESFVLDLASANFVEPPGVGDLLFGSLESDMAIKVTSQSGGSIDAFFGLVEGGEQDPCAETSDLPTADWDDPVMSIGPTDVDFDAAGVAITLSNFTFAAAATDSCNDLRDGLLLAELDARVLAPVLGELLGTTDPDAFCELIAGFGVTCSSCDSDGQPYCLNVAIDQIPADGGRVDLDRISAGDIAGNPECK